MKATAPEKVLTELSRRLASQFGMHYPPARMRDLPRKMQPLTKKLGFATHEECLTFLANAAWGTREVEALIECLTVAETYFFRDAALWNYFAEKLLPELRERGGGISVWSAACCTGEEPYTFGMTLDTFLEGAQLHASRIVASDLNQTSLNKASNGEFGPWSLRATPAIILDKYFKSTTSDRYRISEKIRSMVTFRRFNLMDLQTGSAPPAMPATGFDVIICRNVLIYFSSEQTATIIEEFHKYLATDGVLLLTPCDVDLASRSLYELIREPGLLVLRKRTRSGAGVDVPPRLRPIDPSTGLPAMPGDGTRPASRPGVGTDATASRNSVPTPSSGANAPWQGTAGRQPAAAGSPAAGAGNVPYTPEKRTPSHKPPAVPHMTSAEAEELVGRGQYEKAINGILSAFEYARERAEAHDTTSVFEMTPDVELYLVLLRALSNQGRTDEALHWVDKALTTFPLHEILYFWRAALLQQDGRDEEAVRALQQAVFVDTDFVMAHFSLFMLFNRLERYTEAEVYRRNSQELLEKLPQDEKPACSEELTVKQIETIMKSLVKEDGRTSKR
jgi:chemotaxis protein methyltransferase CheR